MISLNAILQNEFATIDQKRVEEHNRRLAEEFARQIPRLGGHLINSRASSGIVAVRFDSAKDIHAELENKYGLTCHVIGDDLLRFSFHYYLGQGDVNYLLTCIAKIVTDRRRERT